MKENQNSLSIYVPKYQREWMREVEAWVKEIYPDIKFSDFLLDCVRNKINNLNSEETKRFNEIAEELVSKSFKTGDQNGKTQP